GIIGMGRIGKELAKRAFACGMKVQYHNRNPLSDEIADAYHASYVSIEDLLKSSDVISIHAPLTPSTKHLINEERLVLMKSSAFLVNTARGGVIDQKALVAALQKGQIAGAALDVFEHEPQVPPELLEMEQVVITPHNGTGTNEARQAMLEEALGYITAFLSGQEVRARIV
ncbi:MAG: NAD(P)-binding domain-containing protein, partial [Cyclobacteriaceae bacterium]|nr:NAD(P)-binding domain-containing protein [Cyclobacteriaceae bacterium]